MERNSSSITESIVEQAALDWLNGLGYETLSGLAIARGEPAAERADYEQILLFDRIGSRGRSPHRGQRYLAAFL